MKNLMKISTLSVAVITLGACSTITTGTTQPFEVVTEKATGAKCELIDSKGARWVIPDTPGTVEITKGDGPLDVTCSKSGFKSATVRVEEGFAGATLGNVILGGGIGLIVDAASGAAQEYPDTVVLWLEPNNWSSNAQKEEFMSAKAAYEAEQTAKKTPQKQNEDGQQYN